MGTGPESSPPPGWYPVDGDLQRYWNGEIWTESTAPLPQPGAPPGSPVAVRSSSDETTMAVLIHVLAIFTGIFGPLIIWLIKRDESAFIDHHGREAMNFQITLYLAGFVSFILVIVLIGLVFLLAIFVLAIVMPIIAALAASRHEEYRYPLTLRLL